MHVYQRLDRRCQVIFALHVKMQSHAVLWVLFRRLQNLSVTILKRINDELAVSSQEDLRRRLAFPNPISLT